MTYYASDEEFKGGTRGVIQRYGYPVNLSIGADGRVLAVLPDLPGAATDGGDRAEALVEAADCLEEALAGYIDRREPIPAPSPARGRPVVTPGAMVTAKAALYSTMREQAVTNTPLARRLGCAEGEVRRMLDPRHPTKIGRLETALAALGRRLIVGVGAA